MGELESVRSVFDSIKRVSPSGIEYWMARDLQEPLGYSTWENFKNAVNKAQMACESVGVSQKNHIRATTNMVSIGSGAERSRRDYFVSRYGAYLIAMNGDPRLEQIAAAQSYFAVQTRKQEMVDQLGAGSEKRIELRDRVRSANLHLGKAAKASGVQSYALFHDAGYRGLYGMRLSEIKKKKGIGEKEDLLDRAGRAELAANEFRITQAEEALRRGEVKGDLQAREVHHRVGQEVRKTITKLSGTMPEDLPAEPSIKKISPSKKKFKLLKDKNDN